MTPFFTSYTKLANTNEAPEFLYLWAAVSGVAALLSRRVWLPFGSGRINPNFYIMIVGDPGTRKSTAIKDIKKRLKAIGYNSFVGDKVTMQKYLCDLAGVGEEGGEQQLESNPTLANLGLVAASNTEFAESFIAQDEFSDFIGINNYPFISLLGNFWDIDAPYEYRLKNGQSLCIPTPLVNVLGGTTPGQFNTIFPPAISDQGFLSRLVLVSAKASGKKISWPAPPDTELLAEIDSKLLAFSHLEGEMTATAGARQLLDRIYRNWSGVDDGRFLTYATRRHTQLLKLAMIVAATELSLVLGESAVLAANTLLTYTEHHMPDALGQFGKEENSDVANKLIDILTAAHRPMALTALYPHVSRDIKYKDYMELIQSIHHSGRIQLVPGQGFLPVKKPVAQTHLEFVDWQLLRGLVPDWSTLPGRD